MSVSAVVTKVISIPKILSIFSALLFILFNNSNLYSDLNPHHLHFSTGFFGGSLFGLIGIEYVCDISFEPHSGQLFNVLSYTIFNGKLKSIIFLF